jgi:hypothetical protein
MERNHDRLTDLPGDENEDEYESANEEENYNKTMEVDREKRAGDSATSPPLTRSAKKSKGSNTVAQDLEEYNSSSGQPTILGDFTTKQ